MSSSSRHISLRLPFAAGLLALMALLPGACASGGKPAGTSTGGTTGSGPGGSTTTGTGGGDAGRPPDPPVKVDLQGRAYDLKVPSSYDPSKPAPLVVMMHDLTDASTSMTPWSDLDTSMKMSPEADNRGILLALLHGSFDATTQRFFWNATDACCDYGALATNDVGYVMAVIADVAAKYAVDPRRVFAFGYGNGGFMAHRLACDQADKFAAIVSLAGAVYADPSKCAAAAPVAILEVHGDTDFTAPYAGGPYHGEPDGGAALPPAPGAIPTIHTWVTKNGCSLKADTTEPPISLVADSGGPETTRLLYKSCEANGDTELWTMHLVSHAPSFNASWPGAVLDFLTAHPKP